MDEKLELKDDIEPTGEDLEAEEEAAEEDPVSFWERRQRDVVLSVLDYNLGTLADLIQAKVIDLSPRYQRRFRWDASRQSQLIESFLMNVPIPPIFLNEDSYGKYSVIDGKQRLNAIYSFMRGRLTLTGLKVFREINGDTVDDLPQELQNVLKTRANLRAVIILRQSDQDVKFEVFKRLNTGGVRLNPQEIRNSTWPGPLNDLVLDLSEDPKFHGLMGIRKKENSSIYREMRDAEFVLRYFAFRNSWQSFNGGMMRHMDGFMAKNQRMSATDLQDARNDFLHTLEAVSAAFGEQAFQRWVPARKGSPGYWRQQVLASLFDAEMFACRGLSARKLAANHGRILARMIKLFSDENFRQAIDAATNTPALFRRRIEMVKAIVKD